MLENFPLNKLLATGFILGGGRGSGGGERLEPRLVEMRPGVVSSRSGAVTEHRNQRVRTSNEFSSGGCANEC